MPLVNLTTSPPELRGCGSRGTLWLSGSFVVMDDEVVSSWMQAQAIQDMNQDPIQYEKKINSGLSLWGLFLHDTILTKNESFQLQKLSQWQWLHSGSQLQSTKKKCIVSEGLRHLLHLLALKKSFSQQSAVSWVRKQVSEKPGEWWRKTWLTEQSFCWRNVISWLHTVYA